MHRTKLKLFGAIWTLLLGLSLIGPSPAQEGKGPDGKTQESKASRTTQLVLPLNATQRVQLSNPKKKIKRVDNPRSEIARVVQDVEPTGVLVTGLQAGSVRIVLTSEDDVVEELVVTVQQFDVEYLRQLYRQVVPTAAINPIPSANNTLILAGTVARAEDVDMVLNLTRSVVGERVLSMLRVGGVMQVQLEVAVAQVARSEARRMAFEFLNFGQRHVASSALGALAIPVGGISGTFPGSPTLVNTVSTVNGGPINAFFAIFDPRQDFFGFLQLLRDENLVKLQTFPKVVAMSGRQVSFLSGGEQAVPVPGGLGQVGVQFEEFGTRLNALPIVMGNGKIHLELEPEVSALNAAFGVNIAGTNVPGRSTQRMRTTVELESGQTLCLAGLIQNNITGNTRKVPILGDLPFIGAAFSQKFFNEEEIELVILVTPRLVDPMACDQLPRLPGQETRSPDDFELFLEGILEAPRGQREVFPNQKYRAAFQNSPTASMFPCGVQSGCYGHGHGRCAVNGTCTTGTPAALPIAGTRPQASQVLPPSAFGSKPVQQPNRSAEVEASATPIQAVLPPAELPAGVEAPATPPAAPDNLGGER